jgi:hypothetical protein
MCIAKSSTSNRPGGGYLDKDKGLRPKGAYRFSEVFDLKPISGRCLKNSAHLSNFFTPRTVSAGHSPEGPAPKGQESIAQGLPWVSQNKRFALKGLEMRTRSGSKVRNRFSRYPVAPSGPIRAGEKPRVNPGLCFLGPSGHMNDATSRDHTQLPTIPPIANRHENN